MADAIDEAEVRRIAKLARLNLTDEEVARFTGQLCQVLKYFRCVDEVDTHGVAPLAHALPVTNVLRDDVPAATLDVDQALANAPERAEALFKVPPILDPHGGT